MKSSPTRCRSSHLVICAPQLALVFCAALLCTACEKKSALEASAPFHYEVHGLVRGLPPDHKTIDVEHEDIPGFMSSMTMPFEVRDAKEIAGLGLSDAISFRLNVTQRDSWIDRVRKIAPGQLHLPRSAPSVSSSSHAGAQPRLHEGDPMPDFQLIDENGKPATLEMFRGHPFVATFIFTRCPLPNFCPRMSNNFAELQTAIKAADDVVANARLLSITIDPAFDTPQILKEYGAYQKADASIWTLATGDPAKIEALTQAFSVYNQVEGGTISHGLATALIGKGGTIDKIWRGNAWTPAEILSEIRQGE